MHQDIKLLKQYYWRLVKGRLRSFMKTKNLTINRYDKDLLFRGHLDYYRIFQDFHLDF